MQNKLFKSYMRHVRGERHSLLGCVNQTVAVCRDFLYKHGLVHISVGNLTYGGTNKTPFSGKIKNSIFVLADGKIQQEGTHEKLLYDGGLYTELYKLQFAGDRYAE